MNEWSLVFMVSALIYIGTAILFIIFGSTEIQSWNGQKQQGGADASQPPLYDELATKDVDEEKSGAV